MANLNNVTNQLLNEYDLKFNQNYNDIVQLDSTIQNKDQLILQTNEVILYKERNIIILQYLLYFSICFFILSILFSNQIIKSNVLIILSIILFIILGIACYIHVARQFSYINIQNKLEGVKVAMVTYAQKLKDNKIPEYECPSNCETDNSNSSSDEESNDSNFNYSSKESSSLKIDPSLNVWKYGSVPVRNVFNIEGEFEYLSEDESTNPRPFFGTSYPQTIYYQCKWLGNKSDKNMPKNMRSGSTKYSTIPCNYRPNNTEEARLFCQKDPNNLTSEQIQEYCQIYDNYQEEMN